MNNIKDLISIGKHHFENKEYDQAAEYLRRIIEWNPNYADVFNMLGVIAHTRGQFSDAKKHFERALAINPRYTEATLNLAVLYNDLGQYQKAKVLYASLQGRADHSESKIEPVLRGKLSNLHADIGDIYRSIGLAGHAIEEYRKALSLNPSYLDIRTKLGQSLREHGETGESLIEFKAVLQSNPRYVPALIQQGVTYYTMQKIPEAKKAWKKALSINPEDAYARMYLRLCEAIDHVSTSADRRKGTPAKRKARKPARKVGKTARRPKKR